MNFKAQNSFGEFAAGRGALIKRRSVADHHREKKPPINFNYNCAWGARRSETRRREARGHKAINGKGAAQASGIERVSCGREAALTVCIFTPFGQQMRCEDAELLLRLEQ